MKGNPENIPESIPDNIRGNMPENFPKNCLPSIPPGMMLNRHIIHQLIGFAIKHRKIMQGFLDETGVFQAQHRLLMEIFRNRSASQSELAKIMGISAASVAVSLKKLEKGGYIQREVDEGDNRYNQIALTEKGQKVVERSREIFELTDRKVLEGFTDEEKRTLSILMDKVHVNLDKMEEEIKNIGARK